MTRRAICVFCGSRFGSNPEYRDLAQRVGQRLATQNTGLIYGGGALGLMGVVSDSALAAGGHVTGIIPGFLRHVERQHDRLSRLIVTRALFERKQTMFDLSDGFLALPGGVGTLDHLYEGISEGHASAVLAASIFHFGTYTIAEAKQHLLRRGALVRDPDLQETEG